MSEMDSRSVTCVIAGGGPAGLMAGFLFARAGVRVLVLEKHKDFLRDFRGDTIHASTFEVMWELGLLDRFLRLPIVKVSEITGNVGGKKYLFCDFSRLPTKCKFIGFIPQWDFLNFLAKEGKRFPEFGLEMESEVTELLYADGRTCGLRYNTPQGPKEIRAQLVISAEGRDSHLRQAAQLEVKELGSEIDCLWFKLPWKEGDPTGPSGNNAAGSQLTSIYRGDYWQCALFIEKGGYAGIRSRGLAGFDQFLG